MVDVFPRVPWLLERYAKYLGTTPDDTVQVNVPEDYLFYASLSEINSTADVVRCTCDAGIPGREEIVYFKKNEITPLQGGEIYLSLPKNPGKIVLYVDGLCEPIRNNFNPWNTVVTLQKMCNAAVLGGDPDEALKIIDEVNLTEKTLDVLILNEIRGNPL